MGSSYIVLINFYLTSLHNTGKYPVVYSCMRKFISSIHQTFLGLFMIFYFALLVLFAVWTLLGAILNPAKFLPYAAGTATVLTTIAHGLSKIKEMKGDLFEGVSKIVDQEISSVLQSVMKSIAKAATGETKAEGEEVTSIFGKSGADQIIGEFIFMLISLLGKKLKDFEPSLLKNVAKGDIDALGDLFAIALGIDKEIILVIIAVLQKNKKMATQGIADLAASALKVKPALVESFADMALVHSKQELINAIRNLFTALYPQVQTRLVDQMLIFCLEGELTEFVELFKVKIDKKDDNKEQPLQYQLPNLIN